MKTWFGALACVALLSTASRAGVPVPAPGLNLSWNDCGAAGLANRDFACDTNSGTESLVGSVVMPEAAIVTVIFTLRISVFSGTLENWWQLMASGACRSGALQADFLLNGFTSCEHYWGSAASRAFGYSQTGVSGAVIQVAVQVPFDSARVVTAGTEIYGFRLLLSHSKSTGADSCGGCSAPAAIRLTSADLSTWTGTVFISQTADRNEVSWQGGIVPTRKTSWGQIKALYRRR